MTTYPDETLEYYADRFVYLRLARHGITLPQYLANVEHCERRALEAEPPLPAQQATILRLWAEQDTGLSPRGSCYDATPIIPESEQGWRALLARWKSDVDAAEKAVAHLPQRNGAVVEPLHHHRHPARSSAGNFAKRGA